MQVREELLSEDQEIVHLSDRTSDSEGDNDTQ